MKKHAIGLALGVAAILSGCNSAADTTKEGIEAQTLTVKSVDDLKGYTIISNEANTGGIAYTMSVRFKCEGGYAYSDTHSGTTDGDTVALKNSGNITLVTWGTLNSNDGGYVELDADHKLSENKSCWLSKGLGGSHCASGLYVKTIKHDTICQ